MTNFKTILNEFDNLYFLEGKWKHSTPSYEDYVQFLVNSIKKALEEVEVKGYNPSGIFADERDRNEKHGFNVAIEQFRQKREEFLKI